MSIAGTWRLQSCETLIFDNPKAGRKRSAKDSKVKVKTRFPYGKSPDGILIYTPRGHMSVTIAAGKRPKFRKKNLFAGSTKQKVSAIESFVSYAGKYRLEGRMIVHDVQICLFPDWSGAELQREMNIEGNLLTLSVPPYIRDGKKQITRLVWKRVEL